VAGQEEVLASEEEVAHPEEEEDSTADEGHQGVGAVAFREVAVVASAVVGAVVKAFPGGGK
jgi:hypothetical protein